MDNHATQTNEHTNGLETPALSQALTKRLAQLGLSRREFAARSGLSRQTIHHIEIEHRTNLAPATLQALDIGLRWVPGTAYALCHGEPVVNEPETNEEREHAMRYLGVRHIMSMSLEDLECMLYKWAESDTDE